MIPKTLLKVHSDVIVPYIMDIVNTSIASGSFTKNIKQAFLRPLLKKMGLDLALYNYRLSVQPSLHLEHDQKGSV